MEWTRYEVDLKKCDAGISEKSFRRATKRCRQMATQGLVSVREFAEGLGRLAFAASILIFTKTFLGPEHSWPAIFADSSVVQPLHLVTSILFHLAGTFKIMPRPPLGVPVVHRGNVFRAGARAEGEHVAARLVERGGFPSASQGMTCRVHTRGATHIGRSQHSSCLRTLSVP